MPSITERLKQRKLVQWAVAYLAAAWLVLQVLSLLAQPFAWPDLVLRAATVTLGVGLIAVLVLAWYHGEKGAQRVSGPELIMIGALMLIAGAGVAWVARGSGQATRSDGNDEATAQAVPQDDRPLVLMMDSPHPARVYDTETLAANGTNADVISDILLDLPIRRQKEAIGPSWHREEEIKQFEPDLIVIHWSGFCQQECTDRTRLLQLVQYFGASDTQFLIYSRAPGDSLRLWVNRLLQPAESAYPGTLARVSTFGVTDHGPPRFRDPVTAGALKLRIKSLLGLP